MMMGSSSTPSSPILVKNPRGGTTMGAMHSSSFISRKHRNAPLRLRLPLLLLSTLIVILLSLPVSTVNAAALGKERRESPNQRKVFLHNQSGRRVDAFWINRADQPNTFHTNSEDGQGYPFGASQGINSYIGHEFEIREMPSKKTGECQIPGECQTGYFQVNDQEGQSKYIAMAIVLW